VSSPAEPSTRPRLPAKAGATTAEQPWPVRVLTARIGEYISKMPSVWVEGQVVQLTRRGDAATAYLTLRDPDVDMSLSLTVHRRVLDAMMSPLVEGARVVIRATPGYWEKRGTFSLQAHEVRPVGVGELLAQVEHLRRLLASEGLFELGRKRALPFAPGLVGLVCGRESAAEHDVVVNAQERWPAVGFEIRRVAVQGPGAVAQVRAAIEQLDADPRVEVIVVARGGGSLEDLLPFSNEALVRAVAACRTPVVSAIGHEADAPLLDLVADLRASTPTDAAKRIVPAVAQEQRGLDDVRHRLRRCALGRLEAEQTRLDTLRSRPVLADPGSGLDEQLSQVGALRQRCRRSVLTRLDRAGDEVRHLRAQVRALSPAATMERGYAVVHAPDGSVLREATTVQVGDALRIRVAHGEVGAEVTGTSGTGRAASRLDA